MITFFTGLFSSSMVSVDHGTVHRAKNQQRAQRTLAFLEHLPHDVLLRIAFPYSQIHNGSALLSLADWRRTQNLREASPYLRRILLGSLRGIDFSDETIRVADNVAEQLTQCVELETLNLSGCAEGVDDSLLDGLAASGCRKLRALHLGRCWDISARGIVAVVRRAHALQVLNIGHCRLGPPALRSIFEACQSSSKVSELTCLGVDNVFVGASSSSSRALLSLKSSLAWPPSLEQLEIGVVSPAELKHVTQCLIEVGSTLKLLSLSLGQSGELLPVISRECKSLRWLSILDSEAPCDQLFECVSRAKGLSHLSLQGCALTSSSGIWPESRLLQCLDLSRTTLRDEDLSEICARFPNLSRLFLSQCAEISSTGLLHLQALSHSLRTLDLSNNPWLTGPGLIESVSLLTSLEVLDVSSTQADSDFLYEILRKLHRLRQISAMFCQMTADGLRSALQGCSSNVSILSLAGATGLTIQVLRDALENLASLEILDCSGLWISRRVLSSLVLPRRLKHLCVWVQCCEACRPTSFKRVFTDQSSQAAMASRGVILHLTAVDHRLVSIRCKTSLRGGVKCVHCF